MQPELHADAASTDAPSRVVDCDFNGDGEFNGLDIQAYMDRRYDIAVDPAVVSEELQRCLLEAGN